MAGKLPPNLLSKYVLSRVGIPDPSVIVGPSIGEDAAIIDIGGGRVLVIHVDPITGAVEFLGWLAVHIASNDIAVRGVRPRWLLSVLYLPENATEELIDRITSQIDMAAREVGAMVVGGHTEYTPGIARPLISMTAIGVAQRGRYVTTGGARVGDAVVMTKSTAIEGTAILSTDFKNVLLKLGVSEEIIKRGERFIEKVSVVKEALALAEAGLATSMHDPTEGGLLGGLVEIAYASNKTIYIWEENILLAEETAAITGTLGLDPLKLISSGTLIATIPQDRVEEALKTLHSIGVEATAIGYVGEKTDSLATIYRKNGSIEKIKEVYVEDELAKAWRLWREGRS
ncbi:MAG: AIR synthase family protein [Ignisphaera sp.]